MSKMPEFILQPCLGLREGCVVDVISSTGRQLSSCSIFLAMRSQATCSLLEPLAASSVFPTIKWIHPTSWTLRCTHFHPVTSLKLRCVFQSVASPSCCQPAGNRDGVVGKPSVDISYDQDGTSSTDLRFDEMW